MSDLFNPISRSLPGMAGPALMTGVIPDPPRNMSGLLPGTIMKGTVLGRGSDGLTLVAIDQGTVKVATSTHLPTGSTVTLEVRNAGDRLQVLILSVEAPSQRQSSGTQVAPSQFGSSGSAGSAGPSSGGTVTSGSVADSAAASAPPAVEVIGNSLKAIVVQTPVPGSLLPVPESGGEIFVAPAAPIAIPADAALKAQLLADARLLVQSGLPPLPPQGASPALAMLPGATLPGTTLPAAGTTPPVIPATAPGPGAVAVPAVGTSLQGGVAQRIAALFAAETTRAGGTVPSPQAPALPAGTTAPGAVPTAAPALPAGTQLALRVIAVLPEHGGAFEIAPQAEHLAGAAAPLIGRVLGYTRAGFPVIQTPVGVLMLQKQARLPVGAQVALILGSVAPLPAAAAEVTTPQQALLSLSRGWPTLDDLFAVLRGPGVGGTAGQALPGAATQVLPQTGTKLAAGLMNAVAALRSGEMEMLLGPLLTLRKAPEGKDELLRRLQQEFGQLSELAKDRPGVEWRTLFLPVFDAQTGLSQIHLYYRQGQGGGSEDPEGKDPATRFLIAVNFAVLGAFQLDGLVRRKRFDLLIRSLRRLSPGQRHEISGLFDEALAVGGRAGTIEFRTVEAFPVSPLDELRNSHERLMA